MRVAIGTSSVLREGGGITAFARAAAEVLAGAGHEVLVLTAEDAPGGVRADLLARDRVRLRAVPVPAGGGAPHRAAEEIFRIVSAFDPDAILSSDHVVLAGLFPCFATRRIRMSVSHYLDGPLAVGAAVRAAETDWIVALSQEGRAWLARRTPAAGEQIRVIHNTAPDLSAAEVSRLLREKASGALRVLFPGGGKEHKGADVVLRMLPALAAAPGEVRVAWLGPERFIRRFIPPAFRRMVRLAGAVSSEEAAREICDAHVLLLPSRGEGCPMSLLEAMRAGTIPVVSDCPSAMREIVEDGRTGYVTPVGDAGAAARRILRLAEDPGRRAEMMRAARASFAERLAPEHWLARVEPLLGTPRLGRSAGPREDTFDPRRVVAWHRPRPTWRRPSAAYLADRFRLARHALRCAWIRAGLRGAGR